MVDKQGLSDEEWESLKTEFNLSDEELSNYISAFGNNSNNDGSIPTPEKKDDVLKFLRDVFKIKETEHLQMNRTGNLSSEELGRLMLPVRGYADVANYNTTENMDRVALYLRGKADNLITTSTSKKGFFLNLITTIRKVNKNIGSKSVIRESSLFGGTKERIEGGEEE